MYGVNNISFLSVFCKLLNGAIFKVYLLYQILDAVVKKFSLDRGTIIEYVNCLKLIMEQQSVHELKQGVWKCFQIFCFTFDKMKALLSMGQSCALLLHTYRTT
ncbi:unnamed protein product [Schistosoma spindalis]|nr:unnamed protein product [Schistosoma spindale]